MLSSDIAAAPASRPHSSSTLWSFVTFAFFAWTLASIVVFPFRLNHDSSMYLNAAAFLLRGGVPYVDFMDVNPPLIMYLSAIPVAIARLLHAHPIPTCLIGVWICSVVSAGVTRNWLASLDASSARAADFLAASTAAAGHQIWRQLDYGQREHLLTICFFPYFVVRYRRQIDAALPNASSVLAGLAAGVVLCLKPYFALIFLAPEAYWLWTSKTWRPRVGPELAAIVAVAGIYGLHFFVVSAAMRGAVLEWVPIIGRGYYVYNSRFGETLGLEAGLILFVFIVACASLLPFKSTGAASRMARPLVITAIGGMVALILQVKGWSYHSIPSMVFGIAALALIAASVFEHMHVRTDFIRRRVDAALYVVAVAIAVPLIGRTTTARLQDVAATDRLSIAIADRSAPGDPVLVISSSVVGIYPALEITQRAPGSRFLFSFPIPMFYGGVSFEPGGFPYRARANRPAGPDELRFLEQLRDDVLARNPPVIFIDRLPTCQACPAGFVMRDYIVGAAPLAPVFERYHAAGTFDRYAIYESNSRRVPQP